MVGRPTVWKDSEDEISQLMLDLVPVQEGRMFDYLLRKSEEIDLERMKPFLAFLLALQKIAEGMRFSGPMLCRAVLRYNAIKKIHSRYRSRAWATKECAKLDTMCVHFVKNLESGNPQVLLNALECFEKATRQSDGNP